LALEWERAATETPSEALPADRDSLELRCMEWSAVLCAGSAGGFAPENRLWHSWLEYYAFCDPEHPRSWYDIPPTRIGEFSGAESRRFGEVLATNPEGLIEGARAREAVKAQTGAVRCEGLPLVKPSTLQRISAMCDGSRLLWKVSGPGKVLIWGKKLPDLSLVQDLVIAVVPNRVLLTFAAKNGPVAAPPGAIVEKAQGWVQHTTEGGGRLFVPSGWTGE